MQRRRQEMWHRKWICILRNRSLRRGAVPEKTSPVLTRRRRKEVRDGYLFLLPSLAGTGCFVLIPFVDVFRRSFLQAVGNGFVGLENYRQVLSNEAFRLAAGNTVRFMAVCLPLLLVLSLGLAVLVQQVTHLRKWIKTGFLLPMAIPAASVVVFFQMVFDEKGWLNLLLERLGIPGQAWLRTDKAFWVLVACYIWKNLGYDMILWLAGLASVPEELYEAAQVQGAGTWDCFRCITLPLLKETAFVTALLSFVNAFRVFREAYLLAGDYPHESIYMLQHLFNNWFVNLDIQKMTAAAVMLVLLIGGILSVEEGWKYHRQRREEQRI